MEYHKLQIVNLNQNIYIHTFIKQKAVKANRKIGLSILLFFVVLGLYISLANINYFEINSIVDTATYVAKPTNPKRIKAILANNFKINDNTPLPSVKNTVKLIASKIAKLNAK